MTVSRALREDTSVSDKTRSRVKAVIEQLGYVPDQMAASFSSRRSGFVATLIPSIEHSIFAQTLRGITDVLSKHGLQPLIGDTDYLVEREQLLIETLLGRRPEGIIVTGGVHTDRARQLLQESGIPVVEMWDAPEHPIQDAVGFSHYEAGRMMARHLQEQGYRRPGFIGGNDGGDTRGADRRRGFLDAIEQLDMAPANVVTFAKPPITVEQGGQALHQLLRQAPDTDCVFCVSDMSAFGAIMLCNRMGISVPGELAIAGFGDFEIARTCYPSITTIGCDWQALGETAGRQITSRLEDDSGNDSCTTLMDFSVICREST